MDRPFPTAQIIGKIAMRGPIQGHPPLLTWGDFTRLRIDFHPLSVVGAVREDGWDKIAFRAWDGDKTSGLETSPPDSEE